MPSISSIIDKWFVVFLFYLRLHLNVQIYLIIESTPSLWRAIVLI